MKKITNNKYLLVSGLALMPMLLSAKAETNPILEWSYQNILLVIALVMIAGVMLLMMKLLNTMVDFHKTELLKSQGIEITPEIITKKESLIKSLYDKAWSLVPMEKEGDIDLGHDYDGIRELDNSLPPWWLYTFYFTIVFAFGYVYVYHFSDIGNSQDEEYQIEMEEAEDQKRAYLARQANSVDESNVVALLTASDLEEGQKVYVASCAACHGQKGEGGVGPNLTDPYWIHGGGVKNVFKTIKYGVPEKGMISWQSQLQPATMQKLASYILTLEGTDPPNAKEPQGEIYTNEEEAVEEDLSMADQ